MCGFIGVYGPDGTDVFPDVYDALLAVQHRGQDAAGIVTFNEGLHAQRAPGLVRDIFDERSATHLKGELGIGHVRYPTVGAGLSDDVQPFHVALPTGIAMAHNGNVTNFLDLKGRYFPQRGIRLSSTCDLEAILYVFALELGKTAAGEPLPDRVFKAVRGVFDVVRGAYSVVGALADRGLFAFRDPFGIKPLVLGERDTPRGKAFAVASETAALDAIGFKRVRDLEAGEALFVDENRKLHFRKLATKPHRPCIFELVYFARPDSFLDDVSVSRARVRFGEALGEKWKREAPPVDHVIPIPETSCTAAQAMARVMGVPYREGLVKNRYVGRTFIMPSQKKRQDAIRRKLNPIRLEFEGKRVLLVDDSIVRGNTARALVRLARDAGATWVGFASTSPPLVSPCPYGIDMATKTEFIARGRTVDEVRRELGADALVYLDLEEMEKAAQPPDHRPPIEFCTACFTGNYPTGDVTPEMLAAIEHERIASRETVAAR
ncbi:MAG TPA: amidophosphoribosyltransferase [Planctomycetota bacterium]|nr:amidophosphoribosyltransferase [Planctomycetota bacterium]